MAKALPKKVFVRFRKYEGDNTVRLQVDTDVSQIVDQDETCEIGVYEFKKTIKAKNSTSIVTK